jgi:PadR family transcriptional regulator, regulatory protein AphA
MSTALRASPVSYLVLGIIALRGPSTPYKLKRFVQLSVGHFWPFPHTQLYAEPARLAEAGLLEETREESGRRRRHYSLTDEGRAVLDEWLAEPETSPIQVRYTGLLKLFFSELTGDEEVHALAAEQVEAQRRQLAEYEGIRARYADRPEYARRMLSLDLGTRIAHATLEFWEDLAAEAPRAVQRRNGR